MPTNKKEMEKRGWKELDILLVSPDAYVDHPSFGTAVISRVLESKGFKVGIIAQPDWNNKDDLLEMGRPRLFAGISGGNLDWMVNNYTPNNKRRQHDDYSPKGKTGLRPNRPVIVYSTRIREAFGKIPIVIGGIEASLRRFAHYDYLEDKIRRSVLVDSSADILVYGMGERQILEIADRVNEGEPIDSIDNIRGTCVAKKDISSVDDAIEIPSFEDILNNKDGFIEATRTALDEQDPFSGKTLIQDNGKKYVVQLRPAFPLSTKELDEIYDLPYTRKAHPKYDRTGGIPALTPVKFSITSHRGCLGNCTFCSISAHQGNIIQSRSERSILKEAAFITQMKDFKGTISDVGGPTANMYMMECKKLSSIGRCRDKECAGRTICRALSCDHSKQLALLKKIREVPKVKHVFLSTGIRFDLVLADEKSGFLEELCKNHISGQLKVAPEHVTENVLKLMRKTPNSVFEEFTSIFSKTNNRFKKKQYLVSYFICAFPGCTLDDMIDLALYTKKLGFIPQQIQDFTPTPMTLATAMYYSEKDMDGNNIHVAKTVRERKMHRALIQHNNPKNHQLIMNALKEAGRTDLIKTLIIRSVGSRSTEARKQRGRDAKKRREKKNDENRA
ncbi:YgiQ family radical SAM protein [Candidatus Auribacterota bacterium]